jgi:two-component system cell cycle response regulator
VAADVPTAASDVRALLTWVVRRGGARDLPAWIDVGIVVVAFGTVTWATVIFPAASQPELTRGQVLLAAVYPSGDLTMVALGLCLLLGRGRSSPAIWLVTLGPACLLATDVGYAVNAVYLNNSYNFIVVMSSFTYAATGLCGAAALHPSMVTLGERANVAANDISGSRLLLLGSALLIAPVSQVTARALGSQRYIPVYAVLAVVLSLLVMGRMWLLTLAQRSLAVTDGLTGLRSRRYFEGALAGEAGRRTGVVGVLLVDVDHFKSVNDRYGHAAGDAVLRELARRLSSAVRSGDVVARYGGEEFAVLLRNIDDDLARTIAERVRGAVADQPMPLDDGSTITVTISVGVCTHPAVEGIGDRIMQRADRSLYAAKDDGRNRVVVSAGE